MKHSKQGQHGTDAALILKLKNNIMATVSLKKTQKLKYGVWVLKSTKKQKYMFVKSHDGAGMNFGLMNNSIRFSLKGSAERYMKSWQLKGVKPVKVWTTLQAYHRTLNW